MSLADSEDEAPAGTSDGDRRTITALRPVKSGTALRIYVDGEAIGSVDALRSHEFDLRVGRELGVEEIEGIVLADAQGRAREMALRWLAVRARSRKEVERRLVSRGIDREVAVGVIERLGESGLFDDEAFCRARIRSLVGKGSGPRLIEHRLRSAGIDQELIARMIRTEVTDADGIADELAQSRVARWQGRLDERTIRRRLGALLARRGFSSETCRRAVDVAIAEIPCKGHETMESME